MDPSLGFAQLLGIAQGNQSDKTISSKQLARKREQKREKGKIAPNVKKFLEKKEAEERRKRIEKKLELERLNEARSSADKNKINKHLKVYIYLYTVYPKGVRILNIFYIKKYRNGTERNGTERNGTERIS